MDNRDNLEQATFTYHWHKVLYTVLFVRRNLTVFLSACLVLTGCILLFSNMASSIRLLVALTLIMPTISLLLLPSTSFARCDHPDDYDSAGRRCGGRAASVREGGRLGGDGYYKDSYGRQRSHCRRSGKDTKGMGRVEDASGGLCVGL